MSPRKDAQKPAKSRTSNRKKSNGFTEKERAAMKERARELMASKTDGEGDVLAKIAEMPKSDRAMAKRLHSLTAADEGKIVALVKKAVSWGLGGDLRRALAAAQPTPLLLAPLAGAEAAVDRHPPHPSPVGDLVR